LSIGQEDLGFSPPDLEEMFEAASRSDSGPMRALNEDRVVVSPGLWAVADGMGGHEAGDVAAQMVADALAALAGKGDLVAVADAVAALEGANAALLHGTLGGTSGSTIVALIVHGRTYHCLWAGDSRAYLWRENRLRPLTRDHSLVQELVDAGVLEPDQARDHPRANVITRAIGVSELLQLDRADGRVESRDIFLLCSDGLTGALSEWEIASLLARADLDTLADDMLGAALAKPARDNVSFILIRAR